MRGRFALPPGNHQRRLLQPGVAATALQATCMQRQQRRTGRLLATLSQPVERIQHLAGIHRIQRDTMDRGDRRYAIIALPA